MHGSTPNIICVGTMSAGVPPPPVGSIGPWGAGEGELKTQKLGVVSFVHRTATICSFLSDAKCSPICTAQTCAHSGVEPRRDRPRRFYRVGQKVRKNFELFTISRLYVHISQKLLKIEAYRQRMQKRFIPPLSSCCICVDQSLMGFYRVGQN